jgi:cell division septal protein FtsQ
MTRTAALPRRSTPSLGVNAPGDRRFRRPDVRPARRRRLGVWCWRAGRVVLVAGLAGAAGFGATRAIMASPLLLVGRVLVRGNARVSTAQVQKLVEDMQGQHILLVDLDEFRRRLAESPWVADATMRRLLPSTIEVRIAERTPMAIARAGARLYLVDEHGVVVDEFGPQYREYDLPIVDGLISKATNAAPIVDESRVALARRFLDALGGTGAARQRISQVDV